MEFSEARTLDELIAGFDVAMLVTRSVDGALRSRPMAIAGSRSGGVLHFATSFDAPKVTELEREPDVNVTMQGGDRYLSLSGRARIVESRGLVDELWSPSWKMWFPKGREDPDLVLIELEPETGEYWDRSGLRGARFLLEAGRAVLSGETPDDRPPDEHAKVDLERHGA